MYYLYKDVNDKYVPYILIYMDNNGCMHTRQWRTTILEALDVSPSQTVDENFTTNYSLTTLYSSDTVITLEDIKTNKPELLI